MTSTIQSTLTATKRSYALNEANLVLRSIEDLFLHGLKGVYYAEKKLVRTLPKMARRPHRLSSKRPSNTSSPRQKIRPHDPSRSFRFSKRPRGARSARRWTVS